MEENREIRQIEFEYRGTEDSRAIDGYAAVFNSRSHDLGGFVEEIDPSAFDGVIERSDCALLLNHDNRRGILGRSKCGKGSLKLNVDERGLHFETKAPKTALGEECLEYLRRGDANQCSFAFTIAEGGDIWTKEGETYVRRIVKFDRIWDCSILTCEPAYPATSCSCRSFEAFKEKEEEERKAQEEAQRKADEEKRQQEEAEKQKQIKDAHDALVAEYGKYMAK